MNRQRLSDKEQIARLLARVDDLTTLIDGLEASLALAHARIEWTVTDNAKKAVQIEDLRVALFPFTHDDLLCELGGNTIGDNSILWQRCKAKLRLGDFRRAKRVMLGSG